MSVALHEVLNTSAAEFQGDTLVHIMTVKQLTGEGKKFVTGLAHTIAALESLQKDDR